MKPIIDAKVCNKWYKNNRRLRQDVANKANREKKNKLVVTFGSVCLDCGKQFPDCAFDFHHLDPNKKDANPSKYLNGSFNKAIQKLQGCVLLCACCHRIRHDDMRKEVRDEATN